MLERKSRRPGLPKGQNHDPRCGHVFKSIRKSISWVVGKGFEG